MALVLCAPEIIAYPSKMFDINKLSEEQRRTIATKVATIDSRGLEKRVTFDPATQHVSNTGEHAYVAPGLNDLRGPCLGLNAMANYGYILHNGVGTITDFITGTYDGKSVFPQFRQKNTHTRTAFGMGLDLGSFLAVYGAVFDGDLTQWSVGGPPSSSLLSSTAGVLGTPRGLGGSHGGYESDVSPARPDLYE